MLHDSFMSRRNTIVVLGGKMGLAIEIILTPIVEDIVRRRRRTPAREPAGSVDAVAA